MLKNVDELLLCRPYLRILALVVGRAVPIGCEIFSVREKLLVQPPSVGNITPSGFPPFTISS